MLNSLPKVSVVIPTHDRPELLKKAVQSVLSQTYQDFEIIVIDDGIKNRAEDVIKNFNESRIKYIQHDSEKGGSVSRNTGIKASSGQYIAFLDDDDQWVPNKLEKQMEVFEKTGPDVGFCFSAVTNIYTDHQEISRVPEGIADYFQVTLANFKGFLTVTLIVKKEVFDRVGYFDESLPSHQDIDLAIRIAKSFKGLGINEPLVDVNMTPHEQVGRSLEKKIAGREIILKKHSSEMPRSVLAQHYFNLGLLYRTAGQYKNAKQNFGKALKNNFSLRYLAHYWSMMAGGRMYRSLRRD